MKTFKEYQQFNEEINWNQLALSQSPKQFNLDGVSFLAMKVTFNVIKIVKVGKQLGTIKKEGDEYITNQERFETVEDAIRSLLIKNKFIKEEFVGEYGEISHKKNFDPKNPEVIVKGVGKFSLRGLKENIKKKLSELVAKAERGDYFSIAELINQNSILVHYINAVLDVYKELKTPAMKRKLNIINKNINEVAPDDKKIENWIKSNKKEFISKYGEKEGKRILYATAWKMFKQKKK